MVLGYSLAMAAERIVEPVQGMHMAVSRRWFAATGAPGRTIGRIHDAISSGAYGSVRLGAAALGAAINHRVPADTDVSLKGQAIINGLWGDDLGPFADDLEISMEIANCVGDVVADTSGFVGVGPDATRHLVVLVHGLFESDLTWRGGDGTPGILEALKSRSHLTVLSARYNSGRRISDNGEQLSSMLEAICSGWPVPIESVALVGNSMGGLLIRGACADAERQNRTWLENVSDVVTVATPHRGTPIEKGVSMIASALSIADSTRPLSDFLDSRSEGIQDLRHGAIHADGYPLPRGIDHHFIAAVVTADPANPIGAVLGDLVVRPTSASAGDGGPPVSATIIGGTNHFAALSSTDVIDRVVERVVGDARMAGG